MADDKSLGLDRAITRRQFCQGTAVAVGASLLPWANASSFVGSPEINGAYYPPARGGLRGSHEGSFEVAHALARKGARWDHAVDTGESPFDLVVVGAGISGLAAAWFYRRARPGARILLLDNHDDFGGHCKRNEFTIDGRTLIGYGGCQSIDTPSAWSPESRRLLEELAIRLDRFHSAFDQSFYGRFGLQDAFWLDRSTFGVERLVRGNPLYSWTTNAGGDDLEKFAREITASEKDRSDLLRILTSTQDLLPGRPGAERVAWLRSMSYDDYLRRFFDASAYLVRLINPLPKGLWGVGTDCLTAREAMALGLPGFGGLGVDLARDDPHYQQEKEEPYIFHFPDGNAGLARLLVRSLIPASCPGNTMEDQVRQRFDYAALDPAGGPVKLRLNATVVRIDHEGDLASARQVRLRYVKGNTAYDVVAHRVVYAGWSAMLPYVAPEFPQAQAEAFGKLEKIPLVYANVLLRNWQPFVNLGVERIQYPGGMFDSAMLDFPVSMGGYEFARSPDDPIVVHMSYVPAEPGSGLDARQQNRRGCQTMLRLSFEDYERAVRGQLGDSLTAGGFDPARDIAALTVNRWPHGYAWEYNDLYDPPEWNRYNGPHIEARRPFGRVTIANADAEAYAYLDGSIDAAWRAVRELPD